MSGILWMRPHLLHSLLEDLESELELLRRLIRLAMRRQEILEHHGLQTDVLNGVAVHKGQGGRTKGS